MNEVKQTLKDGILLTDGEERFEVPRQYVAAILKAVPELRYSFEHLGGIYHGRAK
jgi:UDP-N-acetylmuramyl tripeptide synthase